MGSVLRSPEGKEVLRDGKREWEGVGGTEILAMFERSSSSKHSERASGWNPPESPPMVRRDIGQVPGDFGAEETFVKSNGVANGGTEGYFEWNSQTIIVEQSS